MTPKLIKNPKNGSSRISQACDRCRIKKIKCDGKLPSCSHCEKVGFNCKTSDKLTRRSFPKGYTENLEHNLILLQKENQRLVDYVKNLGGDPLDLEESQVSLKFNELSESHNGNFGGNRNSSAGGFRSFSASSDVASDGDVGSGGSGGFSGAISSGSGSISGSDNTVEVDGVCIGSNTVNEAIAAAIKKISGAALDPDIVLESVSSSGGSNADSANSDNSTTNDIFNNTISLVLDSVLFKYFFLSGSTGDLVLNMKNFSLASVYIDAYFTKAQSALPILDEAQFRENYSKFTNQLYGLMQQYKCAASGVPASSSTIYANETSVCFKVQMLMVIYMGSVNYCVLHEGRSYKLGYDYSFLKTLVTSKLSVFDHGIEYLDTMVLFLSLSLCHNNSTAKNNNTIHKAYLQRSNSDTAFLVKLCETVNGVAHIYLQDRSCNSYWCLYVLNSLVCLRCGDLAVSSFLKLHCDAALPENKGLRALVSLFNVVNSKCYQSDPNNDWLEELHKWEVSLGLDLCSDCSSEYLGKMTAGSSLYQQEESSVDPDKNLTTQISTVYHYVKAQLYLKNTQLDSKQACLAYGKIASSFLSSYLEADLVSNKSHIAGFTLRSIELDFVCNALLGSATGVDYATFFRCINSIKNSSRRRARIYKSGIHMTPFNGGEIALVHCSILLHVAKLYYSPETVSETLRLVMLVVLAVVKNCNVDGWTAQWLGFVERKFNDLYPCSVPMSRDRSDSLFSTCSGRQSMSRSNSISSNSGSSFSNNGVELGSLNVNSLVENIIGSNYDLADCRKKFHDFNLVLKQ